MIYEDIFPLSTKCWPNFADNKDDAYVTYVQCWSSIGPIRHDLWIELYLCITHRLPCGAKEIRFLQMACQEMTGTFTSMTYCDLLQALLLNGKMFYCSRPPLVSFRFQFSVVVLSSHSKWKVWELNAVCPQMIQTNIRKMSSGRRVPTQAVQQDVTK